MSVYIRTKEPIKGVVEYSFKLDSVLGEVIGEKHERKI